MSSGPSISPEAANIDVVSEALSRVKTHLNWELDRSCLPYASDFHGDPDKKDVTSGLFHEVEQLETLFKGFHGCVMDGTGDEFLAARPEIEDKHVVMLSNILFGTIRNLIMVGGQARAGSRLRLSEITDPCNMQGVIKCWEQLHSRQGQHVNKVHFSLDPERDIVKAMDEGTYSFSARSRPEILEMDAKRLKLIPSSFISSLHPDNPMSKNIAKTRILKEAASYSELTMIFDKSFLGNILEQSIINSRKTQKEVLEAWETAVASGSDPSENYSRWSTCTDALMLQHEAKEWSSRFLPSLGGYVDNTAFLNAFVLGSIRDPEKHFQTVSQVRGLLQEYLQEYKDYVVAPEQRWDVETVLNDLSLIEEMRSPSSATT